MARIPGIVGLAVMVGFAGSQLAAAAAASNEAGSASQAERFAGAFGDAGTLTPPSLAAAPENAQKNAGGDGAKKRGLADFAGKWKSDRFELDLKADGSGSGVYDDGGGFTAERASFAEHDGVMVLSFLRTKSFQLRKWKMTMAADGSSIELAEIDGTEKATLKRAAR